MELQDIYDPEFYYRHYIKTLDTDLQSIAFPEDQIDDILFSIESLALLQGHKSYLKDVNARLTKYLDAGLPLPKGMANYLSTQLKCISEGMPPEKVVYMKGGKGSKESKSLRDKMIYDFLKQLTDTKEYSLKGSYLKEKESAYEKAANFFHVSRSVVEKAYERTSSYNTKKKILLDGFEEYQKKGGAMNIGEFLAKIFPPK